MNASRSASGSAESSRRISPLASARRTLRRISWRSFLPSDVEVVVHRRADRQRHDRADVLALEVEGPALGDLAGAERRRERVGRRIAAAQSPEVDDVPGRRAPAPAPGSRRARPRPRAGRPAPPGRSRSRRDTRPRRRRPWRRGHRRQRRVGAVAHRRVRRGVGRLDLVAVHQRDDRDRVGRPSAGRRPGPATRVSSWAFAPYASHHARWNAQPGERGRPRRLGSERVPGRGRDARRRRVARAKRRAGAVAASVEAEAGPASGQAGSRSMVREVTPARIASVARNGCGGNGPAVRRQIVRYRRRSA